jgi:putative spermidine/putrescine transport system ATP-binding protein
MAEAGTVTVAGTKVPLLEGSAPSGAVTVLVRPESVRLEAEEGSSAHVVAVSFLGSVARAQVELGSGELIVAQMSAAESAGLAAGNAVRVRILPAPVFAVPRDQHA